MRELYWANNCAVLRDSLDLPIHWRGPPQLLDISSSSLSEPVLNRSVAASLGNWIELNANGEAHGLSLSKGIDGNLTVFRHGLLPLVLQNQPCDVDPINSLTNCLAVKLHQLTTALTIELHFGAVL